MALYYKSLNAHMRKYRTDDQMREMLAELHNQNLKEELEKNNAAYDRVAAEARKDLIRAELYKEMHPEAKKKLAEQEVEKDLLRESIKQDLIKRAAHKPLQGKDIIRAHKAFEALKGKAKHRLEQLHERKERSLMKGEELHSSKHHAILKNRQYAHVREKMRKPVNKITEAIHKREIVKSHQQESKPHYKSKFTAPLSPTFSQAPTVGTTETSGSPGSAKKIYDNLRNQLMHAAKTNPALKEDTNYKTIALGSNVSKESSIQTRTDDIHELIKKYNLPIEHGGGLSFKKKRSHKKYRR